MRHLGLARGLSVGLLGLAFTWPSYGVAQESTTATVPAGTTTTTAPVPIAAFDISTRAERTSSEIRDWDTRTSTAPALEDIAQGVPALRTTLMQLTGRSPQDAADVSPRELDDLRAQWELARDQLVGWADRLTRRLQVLETWLARLRELDDTWAATAEAATRDSLPLVVTREIAAVRTSVRDTQARAKDQRDTLLTLASQVGTLQSKVVEGLASIAAASARMNGELFTTDAPPLWRALREAPPIEPWRDSLRRIWERNREQLRSGLRSDGAQLAGGLLVFLLLLGATLGVRRRAATWPPDDPTLALAHTVAARPLSAALIVAMFMRWTVVPSAAVYGDVSAVSVMVPLLCMLSDRLRGKLRTAAPMAVFALVIVSGRRILPVASLEARLLLTLENLALGVWASWAFRPRQLARVAATPSQQRRLLLGSRMASAVLAVSLISNLLGNVSLAILLTRTVLGAAFLGLLIFETGRVMEGLVIAGLHAPGPTMPRSIAYHARALRKRLVTAIRIAAWTAWVVGTLEAADVLSWIATVAGEVLGARLEIGALSLSAKDVLAFGLTVWVSMVIARVLRALLEDDLLPRMDLPRGVPSAVSAAANYTVLLVGFLLALSAAGLDLGRVTILAGAFGVGIGFGLQNVVNNFVSGLILLFERPIRIGDVIEFGNAAGWVRRIGIRSSTIETFDGAEVIVPNAQLVADRVVNWTLSATLRRIELPIGVAYGSDPGTVLALLELVATAQEDVLRQPPPQALFLGFGPSSLDFVVRAWTGRYDTAPLVRSRLGVAIHTALAEAGIEIPFPQQDLHLRSIKPEAQAVLTRS